jgi:hypothetical protein
MIRHRTATLAIGIALLAAACGGTTSDDDADGERGATESVSGDDVGGDDVDSDDVDSDDVISPNESDQPLDTSGGATSGDEGLIADAEDDREDRLRDATDPWPTDWTVRTIQLDELRLGISARDPRDRIPPIDDPTFEPIAAAAWLDPREPGALVQFNDEIRFYPLSILTRHEIVNDRFGDVPVIVTFCPLCNTAIAFDARVDGQVLRFGVSGLLRNSDLVMWDDATTSLWQQITGEAVVGQFAGTQLELIPTSIVAYGDVLENFPDALSLSQDTGFSIEYGANPYSTYSSSTTPFLFDGEPDPRYPALSRVVGVTIDGNEKAYPFEVLAEEPAVNDEVAGEPIVVLWGGETADALDTSQISDGEAIGSGIAYDRRVGDDTLTFSPAGDDTFTDAETGSTWSLLGLAIDGPLAGEQLQVVTHRNEFWFAWAAFFPDAPVYGE